VSYPLTQAQRRFQKIKQQERRVAKLKAEGKQTREERRDAFVECRRRIEERIAEQLLLRGLEVNLNAVRNLAFEQAKREMRSC